VLVLVEYRPDARLLGLLPIVRSNRAVCAAFGWARRPINHSEYFRFGPMTRYELLSIFF
jgi:hypothetical protein